MGVPFLILNIITFLPSWTQTKLQMEADSKYIHIFFSNSLKSTLRFFFKNFIYLAAPGLGGAH